MTTASLLQVIAQEANRFKVKPQEVFSAQSYTGNATDRTIGTSSGAAKTSTGFTLSGLASGTYLYMAIRKNI